MFERLMNLQRFSATNMVGGGSASEPAPAVNPGGGEVSSPAESPQVQVQPQTHVDPAQAQTQGQEQRPDGHVIRSVLQQAQQTWQQQHAAELELAQALREMGRDPQQLVQELRAYKQQQEAQQMGVDPQVYAQLQQTQGMLQQMQQQMAMERGMAQLQAAEARLTEFAKQYGVDYTKPEIQDEIRRYAVQNNVGVEEAFKLAYFDRIQQVNTQQSQGQVLAAMQGKMTQPLSSASQSPGQGQPVDYRSMSREDFLKIRAQMYQNL